MSESIVAYRYAKALIDLANQQGVVNEVNKDMSFFEAICDENPNFVAVMANPIVRHDKKLTILKKIFENKNLKKHSYFLLKSKHLSTISPGTNNFSRYR